MCFFQIIFTFLKKLFNNNLEVPKQTTSLLCYHYTISNQTNYLLDRIYVSPQIFGWINDLTFHEKMPSSRCHLHHRKQFDWLFHKKEGKRDICWWFSKLNGCTRKSCKKLNFCSDSMMVIWNGLGGSTC